MSRLWISPALIAAGIALTVLLLSAPHAAWVECIRPGSGHAGQPFLVFALYLLSQGPAAAVVLLPPFLPFAIAAAFLRAPTMLFWQWIGIVVVTVTLAFALGGMPGRSCEDMDNLEVFLPMGIGVFVSFPVFLAVTFIGSIRHKRLLQR